MDPATAALPRPLPAAPPLATSNHPQHHQRSSSLSSSTSPQHQQRISAPYGHACTNCAKAKCKCVSRTGPGGGPPGPDSKCDRCHRLGRECTPSATVRKRGSTRRAAARLLGGLGVGVGTAGSGSASANGGSPSSGGDTTTARTAQLEEKLDDLVSLLRSQHAAAVAAATPTATDGSVAGIDAGSVSGPGAGTSNGPTPHQIPTPESSAAGDETVSRPQARLRSGEVPPRAGGGGGNPFHMAASACYQPPPGTPAPHIPELDPARAEECLQFFRDNHLRFFPFVYIPPETTYVSLRLCLRLRASLAVGLDLT